MRRVLVSALTALIAVALGSAVYADESSDLEAFRAANHLYETGNYEEAARSYQHLVGLGYEDATLYYNLGNAYYKMDDLGRAALNYLRARRLAPYDGDIDTNLALVRQQMESPVSQEEAPSSLAKLAEQTPWVSYNVAAGLSLAGWIVLTLAGGAMAWSERARTSIATRRVAIAALAGMVMFGCLAVGHHLSRQHWERTAVITAETTEVSAGPGDRYVSQFELEAGHEVRLIETRGAWSKISIQSTDLQGWIPSWHAETVLRRDS